MRRILLVGLVIVCLNFLCHAAEPAITIQVTDKATGDPIAQADVEAGNDRTTTNDMGQCTLTQPRKIQDFAIEIYKDGYVTVDTDWRHTQPGQKIPDQLAFVMEPGRLWGGKLLDEDGKPVAGAKVELYANEPEHKDGEVYSQFHNVVTTDDAGNFSMKTAPAKLAEGISYYITAKGYLDSGQYREVPTPEKLFDRSLVLRIDHGSTLAGKVLDPKGEPVASATVTAGNQSSDSVLSRTTTDADGNFTLPHLPTDEIMFAVTSDHFAPQVTTAAVPTTQPVEVHVHSGTAMKFHVVNRSGDSLSGVSIYVASYQNAPFVRYSMKTDSDGNAVWNGGPADEIFMNIWKKKYGIILDKAVKATTQPIQITLGARTHVVGTVIDAVTGQSVKDFTVTPGTIWRERDEPHWNNDSGSGAIRITGDGKFTYAPGQPCPAYALRVKAPGYQPCDSAPFDNVSDELPLTFKMVKGEWIGGTLFGVDHKPVANAEVDLIAGQKSIQVENHGQIAQWARQQAETVRTDPHGHFAVSPQSDAFILLCVNDNGFAELDAPALHPQPAPQGWATARMPEAPTTRPASYDLNLQTWANVRGKLMIGAKPAAHHEVGLQNQRGPWRPGDPQLWFGYTATTDSDGNFGFDHVPPIDIGVNLPTHIEQMTSYSHEISISPKPGETVTLQIGGTGRPVVGKLALPTDWKAGSWLAMNPNLYPHEDILMPPQMPLDVRQGSEKAKLKWFGEWLKTPAGKKYLADLRSKPRSRGIRTDYALTIQPDGSFRAEDVPAGMYELNAQFYPAGAMQDRAWGRPMAVAHKIVTVPPMAGGRSDEPLDIGTVPVVVGSLKTKE